jgi:ketol-acid reductoisomerase
VFSDLTGERGVLMGAIQGLFKAQYDVLRSKGNTIQSQHLGHTPSEAFNETVEEATQSLYPLIGENVCFQLNSFYREWTGCMTIALPLPE